jgi:hypothetical protein
LVAPQPRPVYLVTDHIDVPFVQDGLRDGEHIRADMTRWFLDALTVTGRSWVLLTGSLDDRVDLAVADRTTCSAFGAPSPNRSADRRHAVTIDNEATLNTRRRRMVPRRPAGNLRERSTSTISGLSIRRLQPSKYDNF